MSDTRREITAVELAYIFQLAAERADLRTIGADLAELAALRLRVTRGEAAMVGLRETQLKLGRAVGQLVQAGVLKLKTA